MEAEKEKKRRIEEDGDSSGFALGTQDLRKMLELLSKEQLVDLLVDIGMKNETVAMHVTSIARKDPAHRKLFVRGLAWETTTAKLLEVFAEFGEVEEGAVVVDKATGKSRGFGFITYRAMESAYNALREPNKNIDGRTTSCNLAAAGGGGGGGGMGGGGSGSGHAGDLSQRKLYVWGLSYDTTNDTLLGTFGRYGEIEEGSIAFDKATNKSRGFAFVTYKSMESAKRALVESLKTIDGRKVMVKYAIDGQDKRSTHHSSALPAGIVLQHQSGGGGGGGGAHAQLLALSSAQAMGGYGGSGNLFQTDLSSVSSLLPSSSALSPMPLASAFQNQPQYTAAIAQHIQQQQQQLFQQQQLVNSAYGVASPAAGAQLAQYSLPDQQSLFSNGAKFGVPSSQPAFGADLDAAGQTSSSGLRDAAAAAFASRAAFGEGGRSLFFSG